MLTKLNFPDYNFRFQKRQDKPYIFAQLRRKFLQLTPEEWVRQHVIAFLMQHKQYPQSLLSAEKQIKIGEVIKRYDIVAYNSDGSINLIVECKAPTVKITQDTFDQIARYNLKLNADYLMVTNGINHYFCQMDYQIEQYHFLRDIPSYNR